MSEEASRTFHVRAVLGKMGWPYEGTVIVCPPLTPVLSSGKTIGFASVFIEAGFIMADLRIDYATEERLIIETKSNKLYPRLNAKVHLGAVYNVEPEMGTPLIDFDASPTIVQMDVNEVVLCASHAYSGQSPLGWVPIASQRVFPE